MIINNWHLLENWKWSLRDPRLPLTPAALLGVVTTWLIYPRFHGCQGHTLGPPAMPKQGRRAVWQWSGHRTKRQRKPRQRDKKLV